MATSRPGTVQESGSAMRVEISIATASWIPPRPKPKRLFISLRVPSLKNYQLNTKISQTGQWNHAFPPMPLRLSTVIEIQLRQQRWIGSKVLAATQNTIGDILQMVGDQKLVTLPLKACTPASSSPNLLLSLRVDDLDVAFVSARLAEAEPPAATLN
ncbi:hypothetical protein C8R47DRAFT_111539 [Mycena vitilis]|nr:hypothetical protein C8R47DRAFT_111539 [Mycena vitilis]